MKISAVHMNTSLADVDANMKTAENRIKEAILEGTELVLFPEFFTSGFAFTPKLLEAVVKYENPQIKLTEWAKKYNVIIGGSFLEFKGEDTFNTFSLTFPSGEIFTHSKDIPTVLEGYCYTNGDENSVFETPIGNVGVALCWEQIRWNTVKRMSGKIDLLLAGSCWWGFCKYDSKELYDLNDENHSIALNAPIELAKILKVPVVHASHFANFTGLNFSKGDKEQTRTIFGATQVINDEGKVIERRLYNEESGLVTAEVKYNTNAKVSEKIKTKEYWIPKMPEILLKEWDRLNPICAEYYKKVSKPYYLKHCKAT